jgi:hypothetical protein
MFLMFVVYVTEYFLYQKADIVNPCLYIAMFYVFTPRAEMCIPFQSTYRFSVFLAILYLHTQFYDIVHC